jgi:CxxC motif-containing protein (DUF1111 family)
MTKLRFSRRTAIGTVIATLLAAPPAAFGQAAGVTDPGVRGGPAGAGGPVPGLPTAELNFFNAAQTVFQEIVSVAGTAPGTNGNGLGPRFNGNSCALCHAQPAIGGSSPAANPQIGIANLDMVSGSGNSIPPFITPNGPTREARFINLPNGTPDGGVHDLFVISGRADAVGCNIKQPNFAAAIAANNIIFRIPTPVFGLGLVEAVDEQTLLLDAANNPSTVASLGITAGNFNRNGNDGTISRFGWKAQNKSLLLFAGEAYNVEMGVTNELFPEERDDTPDDTTALHESCNLNTIPEDFTNLSDNGASNSPASDISSDIVNFAAFSRLSAAPTPIPSNSTTNTVQGNNEFVNIGCGACHIPQHVTAKSTFGAAMTNVTISPFSDFALHSMGSGLQDQVSQGTANGQQFRSAPLWGVGQRVFFLHDGRTSNIVAAIEAHASTGSEANQVVSNFNLLSASNQQAIVNFLRSL